MRSPQAELAAGKRWRGCGAIPMIRAPMNVLDRYILRQSLSIMVFVTAALSAAVWLAQSLRLVDLIVNRGLSIELFLYLALLILPRFLDIVLPIGAFIAVLFVFNRLTSESELVVMRAPAWGRSGWPGRSWSWPASALPC